MNARGFTLLEALIALAIMGIVLAAMTPSFVTYLDANTRNEERSGAVAAAQRVLEGLRRRDVATMPANGSSPLEVVGVGQREFEVITHFCLTPTYCTADSRHLVVEVNFGGRTLYSVESVFSRMQ